MDKKIIIKGLPLSITEDYIRKIFSEAGNINRITIVRDKVSNEPIGVDLLEMPASDADKAIKLFDGKEMDGQIVSVKESKPIEIPSE